MTYRKEKFIEELNKIAIEVAELRKENKFLKYFNDSLLQVLAKPVVSSKQPYYQLCPKCFGDGHIPKIGNTISLFQTCPICNGAKKILVESSKLNQTNNENKET